MYSFLHATFISALSVAVLLCSAIAAGETKYRLFIMPKLAGIDYYTGTLGAFVPRKDAISMQVALPVLIFIKENVDKHHF